jgi:hypothetical protein
LAEGEPQEITPEQLAEAIRQMKVTDLLASTVFTVGQLAYAKLDPASRDLDQARLAIESLKALIPVLESSLPDEAVKDFNQLLANLQLAYASAASEAPAAGESPSARAAEAEPAPERPADAGRAASAAPDRDAGGDGEEGERSGAADEESSAG